MTKRWLFFLAFPAVLALMLATNDRRGTAASGPLAPEPGAVTKVPQKKKGGGGGGGGTSDPASFAYTHMGDIETRNHPDVYGLFPYENTGAAQDRKDGGVGLDDCCNTYQEDLVLDGGFLGQIDPDGACFPLSGGVFQTGFSGWMLPVADGEVSTSFYFMALNQAGEETKYRLDVTGAVVSPTFPPGPGQVSMVVYSTGEMTTEGKGKGKSGNGCTGSSLVVTASVDIEHKGCEPADWVPNGGACPVPEASAIRAVYRR